MFRETRPEAMFELPRVEVYARVPVLQGVGNGSARILVLLRLLLRERRRRRRPPHHQRVEQALDGAGGAREEGKVGLAGLDQPARADLGHKHAQVLDHLRPRNALDAAADGRVEQRERDDAGRREPELGNLPDQGGARVDQALAEDDDLDDERKHFGGRGDDGLVGFGRLLQRDQAEEQQRVQVVEPGADEEVSLEWAAVAFFQTCLQLEVGR